MKKKFQLQFRRVYQFLDQLLDSYLTESFLLILIKPSKRLRLKLMQDGISKYLYLIDQ